MSTRFPSSTTRHAASAPGCRDGCAGVARLRRPVEDVPMPEERIEPQLTRAAAVQDARRRSPTAAACRRTRTCSRAAAPSCCISCASRRPRREPGMTTKRRSRAGGARLPAQVVLKPVKPLPGKRAQAERSTSWRWAARTSPCRRSTFSRRRRNADGGDQSTRRRWSRTRGCWNPCSTISASRARSSRCAPARSSRCTSWSRRRAPRPAASSAWPTTSRAR